VSVRDLNGLAPNLTIRAAVGGAATGFITMRGEYAGTTTMGADRSIAYYIDDVYVAATNGSVADLGDIARIDVLRGPQGTLFGRNSTGGAISVHRAEPSDHFGVKQILTAGNYDLFRSTTRINTGALGPFSASVSYSHNERRGDIRNLRPGLVWDFSPAFGAPKAFTSARYLGTDNTENVQVAVKYDPGNGLKAVYRYDYYTSENSSDGVGLTYASPLVRGLFATQDPAALTPIQPERPDAVNNGNTADSHFEGYGHSLVVQYQASDALSFKNIFAVRRSRYDGPMVDISGAGAITNTGAAFVGALGASLANSTVGAPFLVQATIIRGQDTQVSDELQANYKSDLLTATVGGIFFRNRQERGGAGIDAGLGQARSGAFRVYPNFTVPFSGQASGTLGRTSYVVQKSYAAFGQVEVHATPQIDLVAGIRYTKEEKKGVDQTILSGTVPQIFPIDYDASQVTYNLGVNYKPTSDILLYAKYSTGYLAGGSIAGLDYGPETAKSVEAGLKADWFNHVLRTNLAVFNVDYDNVQLSGNGSSLTPPRPTITNFLVTAGAGRARGFELETELAPARGLELSGSLGYTDFKFTRLDPIVTTGAAEFHAQSRPRWTANVRAQYETEPLFDDVRLKLRADGNYTGKQWLSATVPVVTATFTQVLQDQFRQAIKVDGYWVINTRASLEGFKIGSADASVALWARNLFDAKKPTYMLSLVNVVAAQYERARTFGVDVTVEL
ncbi:MAG TPA: TonB-dependent receptor, partial [Novosphingobium sp.]|nr:TonB-dependent receptor [Novosphingobium sp.]